MTGQKTKINSTDIKLSKFQLPKIIQYDGCLCFGIMIGNLGKKTNRLIDLADPLAKNVLTKLATKTASSVIDEFEKSISVRGSVRARKGFTLIIPNESMDDVTKTAKSLEILIPLIDGVIETAKHEIKKDKVDS